MRKIAILLAALLLCAGLAGCADQPASATAQNGGADDSFVKVQQAGKLVLGLDDAFPPMGFRDEDNSIVGFDIDLAQAVCDELGVELECQPIDWNSKEQELNTGKIDCIWNGMSINEERKAQMNLSQPYLDNHMALVVRTGEGIATPADMAGKKLGIQGGSSAADVLEQNTDFNDSLAQVVEFKDNLTALMDLEAKGVDAVLVDDVVAKYYIAQNDRDFTILDAMLTEQYAIGFRKTDIALTDKVNEALNTLAKNGKLAEISTKWFGSDISKIGK